MRSSCLLSRMLCCRSKRRDMETWDSVSEWDMRETSLDGMEAHTLEFHTHRGLMTIQQIALCARWIIKCLSASGVWGRAYSTPYSAHLNYSSMPAYLKAWHCLASNVCPSLNLEPTLCSKSLDKQTPTRLPYYQCPYSCTKWSHWFAAITFIACIHF